MVPQVGQRIGPYEILGRLGTGGMGLVFSAWDSRLHRDVAIKILKEEYLTPSMRSRFLGEARAASRLNHPNICTIFDIGEEQGTPYLVMELLKGDTLRGRMQNGACSVQDILCVAEDVADALALAHRQGIIHRDIKPANIVLVELPGGRFQSKVLDFGLAKVDFGDGLQSGAGLTSTGMTVGTVSYMSPEQARGELLDRRSDLFALGVVLYEMATGQLPFHGATSALVFVHLLNDPPEPVRDLNASIPRSLEQVISTCLQKDRNARFQTAEEMLEALHKAGQNAPLPEKQSWLSRLTSGLKQPDSLSPRPEHRLPEEEPAVFPEEPPRNLVPGDSHIRPVKRIRSSVNGRMLTSPESTPTAGTLSSPTPQVTHVGQAEQQPAADEANLPLPAVLPFPAVPEAPSVPRIVLPPLTDEQLRNPSPRFQRLEEIIDAEESDIVDEPEHASKSIVSDKASRSWRILLGALLLIAAVGASIAVFSFRRTPSGSTAVQKVLLGPISNHTGDSSLSGLSAGLELALRQSPHLVLLGAAEFAASNAGTGASDDSDIDVASAERAAKAAGDSSIIVGDIRSQGASYTISLRVLDAATGRQTGKAAATAMTRERIVAAVDSLADNLRSVLGESSDVIAQTSVPLSKEATGDLAALHAFSSGEQLQAAGSLFDAMYAYERAATLAPQFTQAHLRLAELFRRQHAELSASMAATKARASATAVSDRTRVLTEAAYAIDTDEDYGRAITLLSQARSRYLSDPVILNMLALAQRLSGDFTGSLDSAEAVLALAPGDFDAASNAELALLGQNRIDEAAQMVAAHASLNSAQSRAEFYVAFLHGAGSNMQASADDLDAQSAAASVLDAGGQLRDGLTRWRSIAAHASSAPELASAASFALSQGALNRALASDCAGSLSLLQGIAGLPSGAAALFAQGAAAGLCGDLESTRKAVQALNTNYSQAFPVRSFYITDLNALVLWKSGLYADALVTLQSAKDYDSLSLTPYLRALVYFSEHQPQMANVEFQAMLRRRGGNMLMEPEAYPMAQLGMARAYASNGDVANAAQSYAAFLNLWPHADPDSPLLGEARGSAAGAH